MRRPQGRKRFKRRSLIHLSATERDRAATLASYAGSPEHKLPGARSDASLCPVDVSGDQAKLTAWVKGAIQNGHVGGILQGQFPRYLWYRSEERHFEGRLTNRETGEYKGYPVDPDEFPSELKTTNA